MHDTHINFPKTFGAFASSTLSSGKHTVCVFRWKRNEKSFSGNGKMYAFNFYIVYGGSFHKYSKWKCSTFDIITLLLFRPLFKIKITFHQNLGVFSCKHIERPMYTTNYILYTNFNILHCTENSNLWKLLMFNKYCEGVRAHVYDEIVSFVYLSILYILYIFKNV